MDATISSSYSKRFDMVFDYIERHLDEELNVELLSRVANFSKFHFHRQFAVHTGINVFRYIQLMRLRHASYQLAFAEQRRITDIALEAGFENPESFSRAFKKTFGQTPSQFRQQPAWQHWNEKFQFPNNRERVNAMNVEIVAFDETRVAALEHRGSHTLINNSAKKFIEWRKSSGLSPVSSSKTFGIAYDDPKTTEPSQFRFDICGEVQKPVAENSQGVINKIIPGGRCAKIRLHGSHDNIDECAYYLYRDWLPESGEELRDFPLFFHYLNLMPMTSEHELITDIYLPLK